MNSVFITGVSSGIGHGLASAYLDRGWRVFGLSRRTPGELVQHAGFNSRPHDLQDHVGTAEVVAELLRDIKQLDIAILNAGVLGDFGDLASANLADLKTTMDINAWANKCVMDALFASVPTIRQVVTISSGAAINGNRGWSGYSISKAALNMLTKLYSREREETHFCALAPGLVDTAMQEDLCTRPADERYPSVEVLRSKRGTSEMPQPREAAEQLIEAIVRLSELVESGEFADVRSLSNKV